MLPSKVPEQNKRNWFNYEGFLIEEEELVPPPTVKCWVRGLTSESFDSLERAVEAIKAAVEKAPELRPKLTPGWGPGENDKVKAAAEELDRRRKREDTEPSNTDVLTIFKEDSPEPPTGELAV